MRTKKKKVKLPPVDPSAPTVLTPEEIFVLDVGGQRFKTTSTTLTKTLPFSMLARMFAPENRASLKRQADDSIFIDRDPKLFAPILGILRNQSPNQLLGARPSGTPEKTWMAELDFYGLRPPEEESESESVDSEEHAHNTTARRKLSTEIATRYSAIGAKVAEAVAGTVLFKHLTLSHKAKPTINLVIVQKDLTVIYEPGEGLALETIDVAEWLFRIACDTTSNESPRKDRANRAKTAMENKLTASYIIVYPKSNFTKRHKERFWDVPDLHGGVKRTGLSDKTQYMVELKIVFP